MHEFWDSAIRPCLRLLRPRVVTEIGTEAGQTTIPLARFCKETGAVLHTIDPDPKADMDALQKEYAPALEFHRGLSLEILPELEASDAVLIDGDHNWYTVYHELTTIAQTAKTYGRDPLVFVHDIGWPYARRDLYYAPDTIPRINRQPFRTAGINPGSEALSEHGFNEGMAHAVYAHRIRNGVLTAVEDFLAAYPEWTMHRLEGFHGLAVLATTSFLKQHPGISDFLQKDLTPSPVLARHIRKLESARIEEKMLRGALRRMRDMFNVQKQELQHLKLEYTPLKEREPQLLHELEESKIALRCMQRSRSWRMTAPLRVAEKFLRTRATAKLRPASGPAAATQSPVRRLPDVAVVISSHNQHRFLRETVESVLSQTHKPAEIVIVDDGSTDDTVAAAQSFADRGVRYLRGEWGDSGSARNTGLAATTSWYVVFLDADDVLHPAYLEHGLRSLEQDPDAGIAYSDQRYLERPEEYVKAPDGIDDKNIDAADFISAGLMFRRQAIYQAGGWPLSQEGQADRSLWIRILALGWRSIRSDGICYERTRDSGASGGNQENLSYAEQSGFMTEQATLCLSLSGRRWAWPLTRDFLERQTFPHELIHLIILDTSQDPELSKEVREWLSRCDYPQTSYRRMEVGMKGLADLPRDEVAKEIGVACATIYNTFARLVKTPLSFILEDDVIPPDDAFARLARSFEPDVISVSGLYWHRHKLKPVCWLWNEQGKPEFPEPSTGVKPVGGTGFGCLAIRSAFLRKTVFQAGPPHSNYDFNFYASLTKNGTYRALLDWDCVCRHYQSTDQWS